ncbi:MAG: cation transporter [Spirochaetaceae bacterium]|nr:MAG: cation transporter [Spirochaetaceae bacterium]
MSGTAFFASALRILVLELSACYVLAPFMKSSAARLAALEGWTSIVTNTLLFGLKLWVGILSGSVAIMADAWHTISDSLSSVVLLIGTRTAVKPPDREHPFGHGRAELIAGISIGVLLGVVGFSFIIEAAERLIAGESAQFGFLAIAVTGVSVVVKEALAQFAFYAARATGSGAMRAEAWHHRSDAITSVFILVGILLGSQIPWIDAAMALLVAVLLLRLAFEIIKDGALPLLGERPSPDLVASLRATANEVSPAIGDIHHLHLHRYGDHVEVTFHICLDGGMTVNASHDIVDSLERALHERLGIEATVHVDPS